VALVLGSSFLTLLAAEGLLRLMLPGPRWSTSRTIVPHERVAARSMPDGGVVPEYFYMRANQKGWTVDVPVETNSLGLRGSEVPIAKTPGTVRILAIGDSHTFGYAVPEEDTWPRALESELRRLRPGEAIEVVNGGVQSLAIEQEIQLLEDRLLPLSPDLVILAYYWNDMPMIGKPDEPWPEAVAMTPVSLRLAKASAAPSSLAALATAEKAATPDPRRPKTAIAWIRFMMRKSYLAYWVVQKVPAIQLYVYASKETLWRRATLKGIETPRMKAAWQFVEEQLKALRELGARHEFEVVVVIIPLYEQMMASGFSTESYQGIFKQIGQRLEIPVVDPLPAIREMQPTFEKHFIPFDGHPAGPIYRRIAKVLAEELDSGLLRTPRER
jgi:lysophospholipase L1-like esterase